MATLNEMTKEQEVSMLNQVVIEGMLNVRFSIQELEIFSIKNEYGIFSVHCSGALADVVTKMKEDSKVRVVGKLMFDNKGYHKSVYISAEYIDILK